MKNLKTDDASVKERHEKRKAWFMAEASRQAVNRALMAKCESFYDGQQWTHEDATKVRDRGQNPVVYNEIKPTIDWLIGTERRSRVDFFVVSETGDEEAEADAQIKTKLLKYLDDTNRATFERSFAVEDCFKAGVGWLEVGLRGDKSGAPIYIGAESWRNILWDSHAQKRDLSDARYIFRIKVVDLDVALALFPDKKKEIESCAQTGDDVSVFKEWMSGTGLITGLDSFVGSKEDDLDYMTSKPVDLFNCRERIMLIECWSREPMRNQEPGPHGVADAVTWEVLCSIMTEKDTLMECVSPFKHDRFPFIPIWAYRNRRTGLPYGPIWPLLGPQESLNHRMSRSLYEASANQIKMEVDAIDAEVMDVDELRRELDSPDGTAIFARGALSGGKVQERPNQQEARFQLEFANRDTISIRQMSGVTSENRGMSGSGSSGKAILARQEQGGLLTMEMFDNLLFARQMEGEIVLSIAEQFVTEPMTIRLSGEKARYEFDKINDPQPDGTYRNDITARRAHFVVGEQAWKQSFAEASFESLMQVLTQLASAAPQIVVAMLDVVFEMHPNLPRKQVILERIRQINGQTPVDGKMTPEQEQAKAQQAQMAQMQFSMQMEQMQAQVREAQAKGEKLEADAMAKRLESLYMSAQAAQVLALAPQITPIADELLKSAGFKDMGGQGVIDPNAMQQQMQPHLPQEQLPMQEPMQADSPSPYASFPDAQQTDGARLGMQGGIETQAADGVQPGLQFPTSAGVQQP